MFKSLIKKIIGPVNWRNIKYFMGRLDYDEIDLIHQLLYRQSDNGIMFDVGAHYGSSLRQFADDGWQIYSFEPDPDNYKILLQNYSSFPNVSIDRRAVSNVGGKILTLYTSAVSSGISSLSLFHESHKVAASVETVTLADYVDEKKIANIDFLKVDTEGHDLFVLQGFPWEKIKPDVILCEFEDRKTKPLGYTFHDLAEYIADKGYDIYVSEWYPPQEYGMKHKWKNITQYPCELSDTMAWGNIIAVTGEENSNRISVLAKEYTHRFAR